MGGACVVGDSPAAQPAAAAARPLIVDSGGANLASLRFALERLGAKARISGAPEEIATASHVLLPGVGSAAAAMERLKERGLDSIVPTLRQPVLGICLGMQLLFEHSAEGDTPTLGIIAGSVRRIEPRAGRPVPHMGWNQLRSCTPDPLLDGLAIDSYMYFVHSFAAEVGPATTGTVDYGGVLSAAVRKENFWGVQFHPERSAAAGARVLANFLALPSCS